MAISCGFYDSLNGDRKYSSPQISYLFNALIKDGVFMHVGEHLTVKQNSGMQIIVGSGLAWFNSTWTLNDTDYPLNVEAADLLAPRIDAVILEVNESTSKRDNTVKIIKGTPGSVPQKPSLTNNADVHQYVLAYITVGVNVTEITNANIENRIGLEDCPFVTGILENMNIDSLVQEWEAQFEEWFKNLEDTLSGDVAGNLLAKIQELERHVSYMYSATFKYDAWQGNGPYTQTVSLVPKDDGPQVTSSFKFASEPMCGQVNDTETREKLLDILALLNNSFCTLGSGTVTASDVQEKPTADIEVVWFLKKGGV